MNFYRNKKLLFYIGLLKNIENLILDNTKRKNTKIKLCKEVHSSGSDLAESVNPPYGQIPTSKI